MIEKIKHVDDDTVSAVGPRFDLDKVLDVAMSILRTLQRRADMRFPLESAEPTFAFSFDDGYRPFNDESYDLIASVFKDCKATQFDVTPFSCEIHFGPFMADLLALGFDALHGPVGNCLTDADLNWDQLNPTPTMFVMMDMGMVDPIEGAYRDFLAKTLDGFLPQGITWEPYDDGPQDLAFCVRFPHETFGAGRGLIRICRYLPKALRTDDQEEEE